MADKKPRDEGDHFPQGQEESLKAAPTTESAVSIQEAETSLPKDETPTQKSETGPENKPLGQEPQPKPHRGQRYSKLSDAYHHITARGSSNQFGDDQSHPCLGDDGPGPSHVGSSLFLGSHDDLQIPSSTSAPHHLGRNRSASASDFFGKFSLTMDLNATNPSSLGKEIDHQLEALKTQSHHVSCSTIENILAQYDGPVSGGNVEADKTKEYRVNTNPFISQPPREKLPVDPPADVRSAVESGVSQNEYSSPAADTSVTDSQHLLDADAQARELEDGWRTVVPLPLNVAQARRATYNAPENQGGRPKHANPFVLYEGETSLNNPFADPDSQDYDTFLERPLQRDISVKLRNASRKDGRDSRILCGPRSSDNDDPQHTSQEESLAESSHPTDKDGKPLRHIRVAFGRDSNEEVYGAKPQLENDSREVASDDGDWVTEATSDVGFGLGAGALEIARRPAGFKKAGSSLADYSDDEDEGMIARFSSREQIIQGSYVPYGAHQSNDPNVSGLMPRRHGTVADSSVNRHYASAAKQETRQFRPQFLANKSKNPYQEIGNKRPERLERLVFNFDKNAPPKYEFRDSISEYEPATASTRANAGTLPGNMHATLPRPVSEISDTSNYSRGTIQHRAVSDLSDETQYYHSAGAAHVGRSIVTDDSLATIGFSPENNPYHTPIARGGQYGQAGYGMNAAERGGSDRQRQEAIRQRQELETREFATNFSYCEPPSSTSVRSQFNFELLPLNLAQTRNKQQRDSGQTNETESGRARLRHKMSPSSFEPASSPVEQPEPAFITARELSVDFTPVDLEVENPRIPDLESGGYRTRRHRNGGTQSWLRRQGTASLFGTPADQRRHHGQGDSGAAPSPHVNTRQRREQPGFIAPDDYVSDEAARIRKVFFYILVALSILPFFGILTLGGCFSEAFKWATRGEVDRLTHQQRHFLKWMVIVECVIYLACAVAVIVFFGIRNSTQV